MAQPAPSPAEPQVENFIDRFAAQVADRRPVVEHRANAENEYLQDEANEAVEAIEQREIQKDAAEKARTETLDIAWITSALLGREQVPPKVWYDGDNPRTSEAVLEGWPLLSWTLQGQEYETTLTLVLTSSSDSHSENNLVWTQVDNKPYTAKKNLEASNIHALPDHPVAEGDMPFPKRWPTPGEGGKLRGDPKHDVISRGVSYDGDPDHEFAFQPDYAAYNQAGIEAQINAALVNLASEHNLFAITSREELDEILALRNPPAAPEQEEDVIQAEIVDEDDGPHWGDDPFHFQTPEDDGPELIATPLPPEEPAPAPKPIPVPEYDEWSDGPAFHMTESEEPTETEHKPSTSEWLYDDIDSIVDRFTTQKEYGVTDKLENGSEVSETVWQDLTPAEIKQLEELGYKDAQGVKIRRLQTTQFGQLVKAFDISIRLSEDDLVGESLVYSITDPDYLETKISEEEIRMNYGESNKERDSLFIRKDSDTAKIMYELVQRLNGIASRIE